MGYVTDYDFRKEIYFCGEGWTRRAKQAAGFWWFACRGVGGNNTLAFATTRCRWEQRWLQATVLPIFSASSSGRLVTSRYGAYPPDQAAV
jgi:hypothetical protein